MPKDAAPLNRSCELCGREKSVALVTLKQNVSYLVGRSERRFSGRLCLSCMTMRFLQFELVTAVGTWWGLIGSILGPYFLLINILEYLSGGFEIARGFVKGGGISSPRSTLEPRGVPRNAIETANATLALFKSATAYDLVEHEGARWLDELLRDAADPVAPPTLKADALAVRGYVGAADGAALTRGQSQTFTRRFEAYLLENTAPSAEVARVFAKLGGWLTTVYMSTVYMSIERAGVPISDDIRDWYGRILSVDRGAPVIVPDRGRPGGAV
jgi:hypothetical protein